MATIGQVISAPASSLKLAWPRLPHPALVIVLTGIVVETLLGLRLWAQLSAQDPGSGLTAVLFSIPYTPVGPVRTMAPAVPARETAIFEVATLAAIEVYLVAMLAGLFFVFGAQGLYKLGRAAYRRTESRPAKAPRITG